MESGGKWTGTPLLPAAQRMLASELAADELTGPSTAKPVYVAPVARCRFMRLILASGSPQRQALLTAAGYDFEVIVPSESAECGICSKETPPEMVARLAYQKAADVLARWMARERALEQISTSRPFKRPKGAAPIIVACDTVCECQAQILGKPADERHARRMLELLSGREHHVYSGLCLWPTSATTVDEAASSFFQAGQPHVRIATTRLRMDVLSTERIDEYMASGQWQGKAGAFGYQDRIDWLHIADGSESNVIGLPMELLAEMLAELTSD